MPFDRTVIRRRAVTVALAFTPLLALGATCDDEPAPPFDISGTGDLAGFIFFDANEDGRFDPSDGDFAVSGVGVEVRERNTTSAFSGGQAQTDASGQFLIEDLPVGTHDLFIDESTVPAGVNICANPVNVSIFVNEPQFVSIDGRPGCLIPIAEAKTKPLGEVVVVRGIVTAFPGQIENNFTYIEDETAGLFIFGSALMGKGIEVGDLIEVSGTTTVFNGQFEITGPVLRVHLKGVAVPTPRLVTTAEIAASGSDPLHDLQNRFVRVEKARLTGAFGVTNVQNAPIDDGSGAAEMRVDDGVADRTQLNTIFTVGKCYSMNGFAANFRGTGQFFPRSLADVQEVPCE
ncbi:MAG: hypothetical protein HY561_10415 [Gemmatimonadetes bacterium]|nr:hypothetical protein [Gemmatimonadota bacterium]